MRSIINRNPPKYAFGYDSVTAPSETVPAGRSATRPQYGATGVVANDLERKQLGK